MPLLEPISTHRERLAEQGESSVFVYFPENSIIAGRYAGWQECGSWNGGQGRCRGAACTPGLTPGSPFLTVAVAGSALRMRREVFERELRRGNGLEHTLAPYVGDYVTQVAQRAACAILHRMEQRFAVWLLMISDRLNSSAIEITQEQIASTWV